MRADALRNRTRILDAARQLVATDGADVPMEAIARHAGVAVGTLYRHHPTKADLIAAVVEDSIERIAQAAEAAADAARAGAAPFTELGDLFRAVADHHASDRAAKAALAHLGVDVPPDPHDHPDGSPARRAAAAIEELLLACRAAGEVPADTSLADLMMLLAGVPDGDAVARSRYVDIVLAGLRARA